MQPSGTMQERAYLLLRKYILDMVIEPGTVISIQEMANRMEVSRTPVREALIRLQKDSLVAFLPQRETIITKIDPSRVKQERFMREGIECIIMQMFCESCTGGQIAELQELVEKQRLAVREDDCAALLTYDDMFHRRFYEYAGQPLSWHTLERESTHYRRVRLLNLWNGGTKGLVEAHENLVRAAAGRDAAKTVQLLREHLHNLDTEIERLKGCYPHYFVEENNHKNPFKLY